MDSKIYIFMVVCLVILTLRAFAIVLSEGTIAAERKKLKELFSYIKTRAAAFRQAKKETK